MGINEPIKERVSESGGEEVMQASKAHSNYWKDPSYLQRGNVLQQRAYQVLMEHQVLEILERYDPVIVGTIPIDINIKNSDIDIICEVDDTQRFCTLITESFHTCQNFELESRVVQDIPRIVASFSIEPFDIEIFGQPIPVDRQNGLRHMMIESRVLELAGEEVREHIRHLKRNGLKTEPAFAHLLQLEGDPFKAVLELEDQTDEELLDLIKTKVMKGCL